ncbi:hypothetical protein AWC05_18250 [Mycobacterium florentinum]|uniref:DUF4386 domain-containing protein n=1 Tax=Mycobacterium florentinum TaxID=292462 RepID=A0A1X1UCG3_MYCFL|nr:hypothetical protein [Mycobacterium florentinum]MCV7412562.1 hypothetical protein [Mycobacterium florentinum]ORV54533.1 hypothetical protein AWC05_18250 [Mycobacterium florentinum]BBX81945.1 hypothetical protein MFLOJ_57320 [Mycobacterium florentinum]
MAVQHDLGHETVREMAKSASSGDPLSASGLSATGVQRTFQRVCALSGIVCPLLFFGGLLLCAFLPPLRPGASAIEIAAHYQQHATGIRFGTALILLASMFYIAYSGAIYGQIRRIPGSGHTAAGIALAGGAVAAVTFMIPAMLWAVTAFRPDRSPEATQTLNDVAWFIVVMPWAPFMAQNFAFAFAILTDSRQRPLFPRWLGYLNIWATLVYTPAIVLQFFKDGPFAWNGIFVFWLPAVVFGIQFVANTVWLLKAVTYPTSSVGDHVDRDSA